jgi:hypothetical protein
MENLYYIKKKKEKKLLQSEFEKENELAHFTGFYLVFM